MALISKTYHFEAAHQLHGHKGKCANLHGHSYRVEVQVVGPIQSEHVPQTSHGFVMDFGDLDTIIEPLIAQCDHTFLNASIPVPRTTAEYIACWFLWQIVKAGGDESSGLVTPWLVRVWETATSFAEVTLSDVSTNSELCELWKIGPGDLV